MIFKGVKVIFHSVGVLNVQRCKRPFLDGGKQSFSIEKYTGDNVIGYLEPNKLFQSVLLKKNENLIKIISGNHKAIFQPEINPVCFKSLYLVHFHKIGWPMQLNRSIRNCIGHKYIDNCWDTSISNIVRLYDSKNNGKDYLGWHKINHVFNFTQDISFNNQPLLWKRLIDTPFKERTDLIISLIKNNTIHE